MLYVLGPPIPWVCKGGGGLFYVSETNDVETRNLKKENDYEHRTGCTPTLTPNPIFNL